MHLFLPALGILFIALKLIGTIDWPWILVLLPLWPYVFGNLIVIIVLVGLGLGSFLRRRNHG